MSDDDGNAIATLAGTIRRYFERNPSAADSVDGIVRWWLPAPLHEEPLALVEQAMDRLVEDGVAQRIVVESGRVIYRKSRGTG